MTHPNHHTPMPWSPNNSYQDINKKVLLTTLMKKGEEKKRSRLQGKTALGASSPAIPAFTVEKPISTTRERTSSSSESSKSILAPSRKFLLRAGLERKPREFRCAERGKQQQQQQQLTCYDPPPSTLLVCLEAAALLASTPGSCLQTRYQAPRSHHQRRPLPPSPPPQRPLSDR